MIEFAALLKSAAGEIDALDDEIATLNDDKKAIYQNVKETVAPADFKAWRDAVKLRQKRRVDKLQIEAHEERVTDMLHMLEASGTAVATRVRPHEAAEPGIIETTSPEPQTPARAESAEAAEPHPEAASALPCHDPETGEIVETISIDDGGVSLTVTMSPDVAARLGSSADLPAFLDRRKHRAGAAS